MTAHAVMVAGPVVLPLLGTGLSFLASPRPGIQRGLGLAVLTAIGVDAAALLHLADTRGPVSTQAGGHPAPLGITLVADRLSALVLLASSLVLLLVLVFAIAQGAAERRRGDVPSVFHPTYLALAAGICLTFLTGDLFTLFVGLELMLMASYVLISLGATRDRVRTGVVYVVSSLTASLLLLTTIGLTYGLTGTVNLADLAGRMGQVPDGPRQLVGVMLLLALGMKAAVVPLHWWLPDSYPAAPAPVTAVLAALLTKVGVYAILRTQSLLLPREEPWPLLLALAAVTMVVGALGALAQDDLNRVLSFILVSHVGFMLFGLGLSSAAGMAGAILYLVHHISVQLSLFLAAALTERERGTTSLRRLGGVAVTAPVVAALFLVPALSVSGVPPLSGFLGKLALLRAAVDADGALPLAAAGVALLTSLLTLAAMGRVWARGFWGRPRPPVRDAGPGDELVLGRTTPTTLRAVTGAAVAAGLTIVLAAGPLSGLTLRAATDLHDPSAYRQAVLEPGGDAGGTS